MINDHYNDGLEDFTRLDLAIITATVLASCALAVPLAGAFAVARWIRRVGR